MRPRPLSLLVGALTAGPTAEGGRPSAGTDLEPLFADRAARSFAPPPFWSSGCHPEALRWISSDITPVTKSTQLEIPGCSYPMAPTLADHGGLRPTVPRRLLECMPAKKPPISLSPRSLEPGPPELGTPDFTEIRNVPRPFPENAAERACYQYLLQQMQAAPDGPHRRKDEFEEICRRRFHVTVDSFDYCWREANKVTNAGWDQPGRPSRQKPSR
jgi:hypothetical protein